MVWLASSSSFGDGVDRARTTCVQYLVGNESTHTLCFGVTGAPARRGSGGGVVVGFAGLVSCTCRRLA